MVYKVGSWPRRWPNMSRNKLERIERRIRREGLDQLEELLQQQATILAGQRGLLRDGQQVVLKLTVVAEGSPVRVDSAGRA